jgi:hypothetical protein
MRLLVLRGHDDLLNHIVFLAYCCSKQPHPNVEQHNRTARQHCFHVYAGITLSVMYYLCVEVYYRLQSSGCLAALHYHSFCSYSSSIHQHSALHMPPQYSLCLCYDITHTFVHQEWFCVNDMTVTACTSCSISATQ